MKRKKIGGTSQIKKRKEKKKHNEHNIKIHFQRVKCDFQTYCKVELYICSTHFMIIEFILFKICLATSYY
jgi:hypothetical protein